MAKKTKLQGFFKGASQIVSFIKGETVTKAQYDRVKDKLTKKYGDAPEESPEWYKFADKAGELRKRLNVGQNYVAFKNYTKQMQKFNERDKKGITREEIYQLASNNRAVRDLDLSGGPYFKYGVESSKAISKFQRIMMDNDYKKLQYLSRFSDRALTKVDIKDVNDMSLPVTDYADINDYRNLKTKMNQLSERLKQLDANRHINSAEFKKMKAAVNALNKTLETPWEDLRGRNEYLIGDQLEALQAASMNYVQAKGVGRQSSQLGKDRMDFGLDLAEVSSKFMDKFISENRLEEVRSFEENVMKAKVTKGKVCRGFDQLKIDVVSPDIYEDKERGINAVGKSIDDDELDNNQRREPELGDDDDYGL